MGAKKFNSSVRAILGVLAIGALAVIPTGAQSQQFDFKKLEQVAEKFTVVIDMKLEISFGMHTNEQQGRYLGTIVSEDGLVIFDGTVLGSESAYSSMSGYSIKVTPTRMDIVTLGGETYEGEFVGVDRFTRIGFARIVSGDVRKFEPISFSHKHELKAGDWVALYMLLPEFITPSLSADIGMISAVVESPEYFPLTVGFNAFQMTSTVFDESLEPVGVLGTLIDPSSASFDPSGLLESFGQPGMPLLGVVTAERLERLIADPPRKGEIDRGWLGITLQALTSDIAQFWNLSIPGGIIVNDVVKNSPAELAGLKVGDIIFEVNGQQVDVDKEEKIPVFQRLIAEMGPGTPVEFMVVRRDGHAADTLTTLATLEKAPLAAIDAPEYESEQLEFKVRDLVFADYLFYSLDPETFHGVVVSELQQGGLADVEGLAIGDIVQRIDNQPVSSIDDVKAIMEEIEKRKLNEVIFFVWRDNKTLFVNVKTDWN